MNQTIITKINLENLVKSAKQETELMLENGIDINDNSIITPLESIANQYPEIAQLCNQLLIELIREHMINYQNEPEIINEF
ncbi:hypothetical protein [Geminocystis herdmanii]|uniref:hypothetical protein n=1 Tax=Geminocystis herdmanii TaxID=669359 RepID=UPI0003489AB1|nr:hypothetical protein [Geminocystis herdmanii]